MRISIVGSNCKNGMKLYKMFSRVIDKNNLNAELLKEDSDYSQNKYNVKSIPGLVIDNKLVCQGKVLTEREVEKLILVHD